jgi:nucleotide-binding universal stress UspA family protein
MMSGRRSHRSTHFSTNKGSPMAPSLQSASPPHVRASSGRVLPNQGPGIRHILVCVDRSPSSELCVAYALSLASTFDSTVTLLYVMRPPHEDRVGPQTTDALGWEIARQEASAYLERLETEASRSSGRRINVRLEQGRPAERIVAVTRELGADLAVFGSHGESGEAAWSLGSTAQHVLATARSSVLIARGSAVAPRFASPKRILVPLDGSLRTESVLPTAAGIATAHGAELLLVHVVAEPLPTGVLVASEDVALARDLSARLESRAATYLQGLRDKLGHEAPSVRTLVTREADTRQSLIELAERERIDLVVLSAHGSTCNAARPFGSVTECLLQHSTVPLLVLQDLPESELRRAQEVDADPRAAPLLRSSYPPEGA